MTEDDRQTSADVFSGKIDTRNLLECDDIARDANNKEIVYTLSEKISAGTLDSEQPNTLAKDF